MIYSRLIQCLRSSLPFSRTGDAEAEIRRAFRIARQASPCVLFLDEIDALVTDRYHGTYSYWHCLRAAVVSSMRVGSCTLNPSFSPFPPWGIKQRRRWRWGQCQRGVPRAGYTSHGDGWSGRHWGRGRVWGDRVGSDEPAVQHRQRATEKGKLGSHWSSLRIPAGPVLPRPAPPRPALFAPPTIGPLIFMPSICGSHTLH